MLFIGYIYSKNINKQKNNNNNNNKQNRSKELTNEIAAIAVTLCLRLNEHIHLQFSIHLNDSVYFE